MTRGGLGRAAFLMAVALAVVAAAAAARSGWALSVVDGGSMRPALEPADILLVQRRPPRVLVGDVVVVARRGWPGGVAHRVVALGGGGRLLTRGDANPVADRDATRPRTLLGRVVARLPSGVALARVLGFLRATGGRVPWPTARIP